MRKAVDQYCLVKKVHACADDMSSALTMLAVGRKRLSEILGGRSTVLSDVVNFQQVNASFAVKQETCG
jgi:hypothetical protein